MSKSVGKLLDGCDWLRVLLSPKRASKADPIEDLWRVLEITVAANVERPLAALKQACRDFFNDLEPKQALHTTGLQAA